MQLLRFGGAVPVRAQEAALFQAGGELLPGVDLAGALFHAVSGALEQAVLESRLKQGSARGPQSDRPGMKAFSPVSRRATSTVPFSASRGPMARRTGTPLSSYSANFQPERLVSSSSSFTRRPCGLQVVAQLFASRVDDFIGFSSFLDGHDDGLDGGQLRWHHQSLVVAVGHDERAHQTGGHPPTRRPNEFLSTVFGGVGHIKSLGEVLPQEVARAGLQGLSVLHHGFDAKGVVGTGKPLAFGLHTAHHRHGHPALGKVRIDVQHLFGLLHGFGLGGVCGVALLPQEFSGAQEQARPHLPADHIGPLVHQQRQVAVALNPIFVSLPNDGL